MGLLLFLPNTPTLSKTRTRKSRFLQTLSSNFLSSIKFTLELCDENHLAKNIFREYGIELEGCNYNQIINNTFLNADISIENTLSGPNYNNTVINNLIYNGGFSLDITVKEAVELAKQCIKSAIERGAGSGNGLDVFTITKGGINHVVSEEIIPQYK